MGQQSAHFCKPVLVTGDYFEGSCNRQCGEDLYWEERCANDPEDLVGPPLWLEDSKAACLAEDPDWVCLEGRDGRVFWHHLSLGPPPWGRPAPPIAPHAIRPTARVLDVQQAPSRIRAAGSSLEKFPDMPLPAPAELKGPAEEPSSPLPPLESPAHLQLGEEEVAHERVAVAFAFASAGGAVSSTAVADSAPETPRKHPRGMAREAFSPSTPVAARATAAASASDDAPPLPPLAAAVAGSLAQPTEACDDAQPPPPPDGAQPPPAVAAAGASGLAAVAAAAPSRAAEQDADEASDVDAEAAAAAQRDIREALASLQATTGELRVDERPLFHIAAINQEARAQKRASSAKQQPEGSSASASAGGRSTKPRAKSERTPRRRAATDGAAAGARAPAKGDRRETVASGEAPPAPTKSAKAPAKRSAAGGVEEKLRRIEMMMW
eukprot:TRINITY_DN21745_c0_g1_i1.p1 TRINITY_DN21745_c0_g1~~TRINITY_DN21745_c0_g1_i1.p1  ORF type:complete len:438 (+),score=117.17 TRINITY_DN21745_c0_g1_i1:96-1409(+)